MTIQYFADSDIAGEIIAFYNDAIWSLEKIPTTAIPITNDEWNDCLSNPGKWIVNNGKLELAPPLTSDELFQKSKNAKILEIQTKTATVLATFTSDTLGTVHTYLCGTTDMLWLEAEDRFMQGPDWDQLNVLWYTSEAGDVEHTKDQIHKLYLDGRASVQRKKYTAKDLIGQVDAATDQTALDAIDVQNANWG